MSLQLLRALLILGMPVCALFAGIWLIGRTGLACHALRWYGKSTLVFLLGIPVTLAGLVLVAIGLPFRVTVTGTRQPFTMYPEATDRGWQLVRLPAWLRLWDNAFDGLLGDRRGWWDNYCREHYGKPCTAFYSMWQWTAIRNPANYWSRVVTGCDVSRCRIDKLAGSDQAEEDAPGWSFLLATRDDGARFYLLQFCLPWAFRRDRAVYGRFGWKVKLAHNGTPPTALDKDRIKGSVYRLSPWKDIGPSEY